MSDPDDSLTARYRALFETTPDGIMVVDDDGTYVDLNPAMCRILAGTREQLVGRHFSDFIPPDRVEEARAAFEALRGTGALGVEFPVRALDGTIRNLEWRSRASFLPGLHFCVAHDLTARDIAQRALRASDERYRAFIANSSEGIWRFELRVPVPASLPPEEQIDRWYEHAYLAECNDAMARMYGFASSDDLVGMPLARMLVREDPANIAYLRAFIDSGYRLSEAESHEIDRDGNEKYFVNSLVGIVENGFVLRAWGTQRDATDEKRLEHARQAMLARLEFLAQVTAVLGSSLDDRQTLRSLAEAAVPAFADRVVADVSDAAGHTERIVVPEPPGDGVAEPKASVEVPLTARGRALGTLTFLRDASAFEDEDRHLAQDVGRRAGLAIDNALLYQQLASANRAKDEFLAMLSHELRTPMTATLGWATMLQTGRVPEEMIATAAEAIVQSTRAQARLVEDLLDISRIVSGKMQLGVLELPIAEPLEAAIQTVRPAAEAKQITLEVRGNGELRVYADTHRLQQVFWNLLSNATKFTPRGGRIEITIDQADDCARVRVADTGEGIEADVLPFIFDRFRQGDTGASRRFGGLGLGLAIARNLVELHGGTLSAASEGPGHGAEFTVLLPITPG